MIVAITNFTWIPGDLQLAKASDLDQASAIIIYQVNRSIAKWRSADQNLDEHAGSSRSM